MSFPIVNIRTARQAERARRARMRVQARLESRLVKALRAAFRAEGELMARAVGDGTDYHARINQVLARTEPRFRIVLRDGIQRAADTFGSAVLQGAKGALPDLETKKEDPEDLYARAMRNFAERQAGRRITGLQATTKKRVRKRIEDALIEAEETGERASGLIADAIKESYDGFTDARAYVIGRTETHNAALHSSHAAAEALDIPTMKKRWVSAPRDGRNRQYHLEMNDTVVPLDDVFEVKNPGGGVDEMKGPGDSSAGPEQVVNCRCVLTFSTS